MKKQILLFCSLILLTSLGNSQSKILKIVEGAKLLNSGVMLDNDNSANGYYFFYELDKVSKKEREFSIKILDQNLNEVLNKSFIEDRNCFLSEVKYNKKQLMFRMYNREDYKYMFYSLDNEGNLNKVSEYEEGINNYSFRNHHLTPGPTVLFYPIDKKGFLFFLKTINQNKIGYRLQYFSTNVGKDWIYESDNNDGHEIIEILDVNETGIIFHEIIRRKLSKGGYEAGIKILKPETGELIVRETYPQGKKLNQSWNNAFFANNEFNVLGEFYGEKKDIYKDKSKGMFIKKYSLSGENIFSEKILWEDSFLQKFRNLNDEKGRNYLFFHDFINTKDGHIYAVAEQYRKTLSASRLGSTQLTITDAFFIHFDKNFNFIDLKKIDKGKSRVNSSSGGSAHMQAFIISRSGGFDYNYTQIDKKNDRFYSLFLDEERINENKGKRAFKAIIYNNGKLTEDKIYLEDGSIETKAKAAKTGYVLLINHDKKKKEVKLHLEKLNIE